jgi:predicted Zn-dependent protease
MCKDCLEHCECECGVLQLIEAINKNGITIKTINFCNNCQHEVLITYE